MGERISDDDLRKLVAETTPGPWMVFIPEDYEGPEGLPGVGVEAANGDAIVWYAHEPETGIKSDRDADLIALAPALAAEVLQLREAQEAAYRAGHALARQWSDEVVSVSDGFASYRAALTGGHYNA